MVGEWETGLDMSPFPEGPGNVSSSVLERQACFSTADTRPRADAQSNLPDGIEKSQLPFFFP